MRATLGRISAATALFLATSATAAATNIQSSSFDAALDTGSLAGTAFRVCYSYDAEQVAPTGESYVSLNSFDFTLLGTPFTRHDIFQGGQVIFQDGAAHDVTASFQVLLPPGSPVHNITFGFGGPDVIGYTDTSDQYGDGSFDLENQSAGCDSTANTAQRPMLVRKPTGGAHRSFSIPHPRPTLPIPLPATPRH